MQIDYADVDNFATIAEQIYHAIDIVIDDIQSEYVELDKEAPLVPAPAGMQVGHIWNSNPDGKGTVC